MLITIIINKHVFFQGIGSKLMLAMGYIPGSGLGASGEGRVVPVEARVLPVGKSLDQCMAISERNAKDPMKVSYLALRGVLLLSKFCR